ncbi:hypothetical protein SB782_32280, partial [Brevibacillus sp. SIMBA_076]
MKPLGVIDLPDTPEDMPSHSMDTEYQIAGHLEEPASAAEIRLAVADAQCRTSSAFASTFYDIRWSESLTLYRDNRERLETARQQLIEHDTAV